MEADGWTHVVTKRSSSSASARKQSHQHHVREKLAIHNGAKDDEAVGMTAEEAITICTKLSAEVSKSELFLSIAESLGKLNLSHLSEVMSLGIGKVCSSPSSLLQLAMASCFQRHTFSAVALDNDRKIEENLSTLDQKITEVDSKDIRAFFTIYDPMFTAKESKVCQTLGFKVSTENLKGKHEAVSGPTLFFMPHCPHRLYINLLWANWNRLDNLIILGNSFQSYSLRRSSEDDKTDCMRILGSLVTEVSIWEIYAKKMKGKRSDPSSSTDVSSLENAFCDISLHYFCKESLSTPEAKRILAMMPCEADIDEAALLDVELFG